ncbi:MAG: D-alanine--D-alanine ligase [Ignavibacteria bacterium]|nr:D-alanine--D-alanine ligase [Ignavibacteria bacterium]
MNKSLHVLLLVGGASPERQVSKMSGKSIYQALLENGHKVTLHDPAYGARQPRAIEDYFSPEDILPVSHSQYIESFQILPKDVDVVFIGLHGKWGEDGTIQSILELLNLRYTGSGVLASSLAMDKVISKIVLKDHGVTVPADINFSSGELDANTMKDKVLSMVGLPCVVKPNDQGSTVGLTICHSEEELIPAFDEGFKYSGKILIEEFIPGKEITAGILGEQALPVLEIRPLHGIYDYECKYTHGMSEYLVPADIPEDVAGEVQRQTKIAFDSLGCKGYGRADFRVTPDGKVYCLEMNTLPGMTSTSLIPKMAKHIGLPFPELIQKIVEYAL